MKKSDEISVIALPLGGTGELKRYIKRNTVEGHLVTLAIIALLIVLYILINGFTKRNGSLSIPAPRVQINIIPEIGPVSEDPPEIIPRVPDVVQGTPKEIAGTPIARSEVRFINEPGVFASTDNISRAMSIPGTGNEPNNNNLAQPVQTVPKLNAIPATVPDEDDMPPAVEQEPYTDLLALQKSVVYSEIALRAHVEGKVLVKVLVGKDGRPIKSKIDYSDNELLNSSAQNAVMQAVYTPALQNKVNIECWISIPISFKLR
jgi:TonB family protein